MCSTSKEISGRVPNLTLHVFKQKPKDNFLLWSTENLLVIKNIFALALGAFKRMPNICFLLTDKKCFLKKITNRNKKFKDLFSHLIYIRFSIRYLPIQNQKHWILYNCIITVENKQLIACFNCIYVQHKGIYTISSIFVPYILFCYLSGLSVALHAMEN